MKLVVLEVSVAFTKAGVLVELFEVEVAVVFTNELVEPVAELVGSTG